MTVLQAFFYSWQLYFSTFRKRCFWAIFDFRDRWFVLKTSSKTTSKTPKRESHHHHKSGNEVEKAVVHVIANEILITTEVVIHVWPQFPYLHLCRSRKFFSWLWWFCTWWLSKTKLKIEFAREQRSLKGFSQALVFHVVAEKGWLWSFHYQLLLPPSKFPQGDATAFSFLYTVNRDSRSKCW